MSVFENTPQRDAMGCSCFAANAMSFSSPIEQPMSAAIWSMNAPVPPAQLPFMRKSGTPPELR